MSPKSLYSLAAILAVFLILGAWALFQGRASSFDAAAARKGMPGRDLVVITLDTTRFDHLGCYGYSRDTSPAIDRLAREGIRFETAYATAPHTLPTHSTIFTGQDPPRHGVRNNGTYRLPESATTLAELLSPAGWKSAAFVGAFVLAREFGLSQGFDHFDDDLSQGYQETAFTIRTRRASQTVDRCLGWVEEQSADQPLFLWLHFFDPHAPYVPLPRLREVFGQSAPDRYDAEIRAVDDEIARLRRALEEAGRDPVWVILSDHGEGMFDHGEGAHGIFLYQEVVRIPFILSGRGIFPSRVSATVARQSDVFPTLLDLCGVALPSDVSIDGATLLPALERPDRPESRTVYLETLIPLEDYGWSPLFALVKNGWKYIEAPKPELYDLAADPGERENLLRREAPRVTSMAEALQRLRDRQAGEVERVALDGVSRESLAAVGYVSGGGMAQQGEMLPDPKDMIDIPAQLEEARMCFGPKRNPRRAVTILLDVVERNPGNRTAVEMLAHEPMRVAQTLPVEQRSEFLGASRRALAIWRERVPEAPEPVYSSGVLAQLEGRHDEAERNFEEVRREHPDYLPAVVALLKIALQARQKERCEELAQELSERGPEDSEALFYRAMVDLQYGRPAEAIPKLRASISKGGSASENELKYFFLGECHRLTGGLDEALEAYRKVRNPLLRQQRRVDDLEAAVRAAQQKG